MSEMALELYYENSKYCRSDFKAGRIPLFWIADYGMDDRGDIEFHMGDNKDDVVKKLKLITSLMSYKIKGDK